MCLTGSTSFGSAQNTIHDFQNTISPIELVVPLSSTNGTKKFIQGSIRLVSVPNIKYFHKNKNLENKTAKQNILM